MATCYVYAYRCKYICIHTRIIEEYKHAIQYDTKYLFIYKFYSARIFTHTYIMKKLIKQSTEKKKKRKALVELKNPTYIFFNNFPK